MEINTTLAISGEINRRKLICLLYSVVEEGKVNDHHDGSVQLAYRGAEKIPYEEILRLST